VGEDDSIDEASGEVKGEEKVDGDLSDSSPECDEFEEELLGKMSGALYESIFVVEMSSMGAEILCRIVPPVLIVLDRFGISGVASTEALARRVVNALDKDIFAE
jgi:hypothetical protein